MRLYLASTSPARRALLRAAGIEPIVIPSHVDEEAAIVEAERTGDPLTPEALTLLLARLKAEAVVAANDGRTPDGELIDGLVFGGDSAFELDGGIFGKPHTPERARERWHTQRGRTGRLHSGHWLIDHRNGRSGAALGGNAVAEVTFVADISDAEIDAYVASGEPLEVAGAFTIDSLGAPYIERVAGDPSTVVGLSLPLLRRLVIGAGVDWPALWSAPKVSV